MRLVIAGPRDLYVKQEIILDGIEELCQIYNQFQPAPIELINGGATGIDQCAREWWESLGYEPTVINADWDEAERVYGNRKAGGPLRNRKMAAMADCLLVIKRKDLKSNGTASMIKEAIAAGIPYHVKEV